MDQKEVLIKSAKPEKNSGRVMRRLGRTGFEVNALGLGGHTYPIGNGSEFSMTPDDRARLVHYLVSSGVNYFDTTWINEVELLADSFRRAEIKEDVLVSLQSDGGICDVRWREKLRKEVESRLSILGYVDAPLFLMGLGEEGLSYAELIAACEAMRKLKEEKLIRNIGLSCHTVSLFPWISRAIRETGLIDYIMIRFNWKYQQANEELFPVAEDHDVGIVAMKIFCWDCGPSQWDRKISVFEPVTHKGRIEDNQSLSPAQRNLLWCIQNSPCAVVVPSMNSMREAEENIQALRSIGVKASADDFGKYGGRLFNKKELKGLALYAESKTIRASAEMLLKPKRGLRHVLRGSLRAHYKILKTEGLKKYLLYSYRYRKGQIFDRSKKIQT